MSPKSAKRTVVHLNKCTEAVTSLLGKWRIQRTKSFAFSSTVLRAIVRHNTKKCLKGEFMVASRRGIYKFIKRFVRTDSTRRRCGSGRPSKMTPD